MPIVLFNVGLEKIVIAGFVILHFPFGIRVIRVDFFDLLTATTTAPKNTVNNTTITKMIAAVLNSGIVGLGEVGDALGLGGADAVGLGVTDGERNLISQIPCR